MSRETREQPKLQVSSSIEGLEIAPGTYKTATGTIVVPLSRQREEAKKAREAQEQRTMEVKKERRIEEEPPAQVKRVAGKTIQFFTPIGKMEALYFPVIDLPAWVILGKTANSFVPKSYKEDPALKFQIKGDDLPEASVVYTGCEFTDPATRATYLIFMKV